MPLDYIIGGAGNGRQRLEDAGRTAVCRVVLSRCRRPRRVADRRRAMRPVLIPNSRRQFNLPVAKFEGVGEAMARIAGNTYIMNCGIVGHSRRHRPGRETGRAVGNSQVSLHRTRAAIAPTTRWTYMAARVIMMGPNNYLGRAYMATPIAITVEGREHPDPQPDHLRSGCYALSSVRAARVAGCEG